MKNFENYECEGQMELFDIYPKTCCGLIPWLHKTKCCRWNEDAPQHWMLNYICPKCFKRPVDETGWPIESYGTYEEAKEQARDVWNDPNIKHEVCEVTKQFGIRLHIGFGLNEPEEWESIYGVSLNGSFIGRLKEL